MNLLPLARLASLCSLSALLLAAPLGLVGCAASTDENTDSTTSQAIENQGTTLLVSDIDDTIKRTDVLSKLESAVNVFASRDSFGGMNTLYNDWHNENTDRKQIIYLSAAPGPLIDLSKRFLENSTFPGNTSNVSDSVISGRSLSQSAGDFKTAKLLAMYDEQRAAGNVPDTFILIGDNGEQDMIAYGNFIAYVASKGGSTKHIYSFIHHVYDSPKGSEIAAPHRAWVTAADLAVQMRTLGLIGDSSLGDVISEVSSDLSSNTSTVIPTFMSCTQFNSWPALPGAVGADDYGAIQDGVTGLCDL